MLQKKSNPGYISDSTFTTYVKGQQVSQTRHIVTSLKKELKARGITYNEVSKCLALSEASVKRLFAEQNFTLERLEKVCTLLDMDIVDLIKATELNKQLTVQLSIEQEKELISDTPLLLVAHNLMNKWTFEEIIDCYKISEAEGIQILARLDRMKIIELLPGNRVKLLISRDFTWHSNGPIQQFFEKQLQAEFFTSRFNGKGEYFRFASSMLSEHSISEMIKKLKKVVHEFNDKNVEDENLPLDQRYGSSLLIGMRPWETKSFSQYRREENKKVLK